MVERKKFSIQRSEALWKRAEQIIPDGSQTYSKGPTQYIKGFAPKYLERGKGSYVWDVDGNKFLDFVMACHPVYLGYCDPDVDAAIRAQLEKGITFSMMNPLEVEVTELLMDAIPCCEGARFGKNGSDATTIAVRVARSYTGRDHIAYCGYHGWHDWYIANTDRNWGIPKFNEELMHCFDYNNIESLAKIFEQYPGQIAGVIMEPITIIEPRDGFLEKAKELTHANGALLIFDEVMTGFRFAYGGAQELTGVIPDLACFAKAISNGMPLSAITGKKKYIFELEKAFFSFAYGGECLSLAAAVACLKKIKRENVVDHVWKVGAYLQNGLRALISQHKLDEYLSCIGYPCRTIVACNGRGKHNDDVMKSYIQQELFARGILWTSYHAMAFSHQIEDMDYALNAYDDALKGLAGLIHNGKDILSQLEGEPVKPVFRKVADFLSYTRQKEDPAAHIDA